MIEVKVREVAESRGYKSSYELQKAIECSPTVAVRLWRNEVSRYSLDTLDALCAALNCEVGDLLVYRSGKK